MKARDLGKLAPLLRGGLKEDDKVLIINAHGILRVMAVERVSGGRITLEDGSLYFRQSGDQVIIRYGQGQHPGDIYALPDGLDHEQVNQEYAEWYAEHEAAESESQQRRQLAQEIRGEARNLSLNYDLHLLRPLALTSLLNRIRDLNRSAGGGA